MKQEDKNTNTKSTLEVWLTFLAAFAWPVALLTVVLMFRSQLSELTGRVQTGEFAGAKFSFSEAAAGYIRASVGDLAAEQDPTKRAKLAENIKGVADVLGALHPRSLSILIEGSRCMTWVGYAEEERTYFSRLESLGLAKVKEEMKEGKKNVTLAYTKKGLDLLVAIGLSTDELKRLDDCRN